MMPTAKSRRAYEYHPYRRDWGKPPDATSGRYSPFPDRVAVIKACVAWVLEEGASLSECRRRVKSRFDIEVSRDAIRGSLTDPIIIGKVYAYRSRNESGPQGTRNIPTAGDRVEAGLRRPRPSNCQRGGISGSEGQVPV